jgi:hypothetical protein
MLARSAAPVSVRRGCEHVFVRWRNLRANPEEAAGTQGALPGMGDSVIRTFDAPEALGIRFHEVRARSAINGVPERSRMPFRWTINPYRGCTHACVLAGLLLRATHP